MKIVRVCQDLFKNIQDQSLLCEKIQDFWCVMTWGLSILSQDLISYKSLKALRDKKQKEEPLDDGSFEFEERELQFENYFNPLLTFLQNYMPIASHSVIG